MLKDHRELLHAFNEQSVTYLLVGGYALGIYAEPRATGDLDLFIEALAAGRLQDLADADAVQKARKGRTGDLA